MFKDFFATGLRFPLDPVVVEIFQLYKIFFQQMTPTSILRLSLYFWLVKGLSPSAEGFV